MSDSYTKPLPIPRWKLRAYAGARWVEFVNPASGQLPDYPCCYAVYGAHEEIVYVGQTCSLRKRMKEHVKEKVMPENFRIKVRFGEKYGDWLMREARLIARLRPALNQRIL